MRRLLIAVALAAVTAAAYWPVQHHPFVNFEDPQYVVENAVVQDGLTWPGVKWAFTMGHTGTWHPVTWLSHMIDVELFGLDAGRHHLVSLGLHILTTLLLFGLLVRMTAADGASAFVAAVFALHPLHVESVAWIAGRKDVLSALFFMLTIGAHIRYVRRPSRMRYVIVAGFFALGLMATPMLVTLPLVLLLLDVWPLDRPVFLPDGRKALVVEKWPLFALAIASSVVTFVVQQQPGAVQTLEAPPFMTRLANAVVGHVAYLGQSIWPADLAPINPAPEWQPIPLVLASATALLAMTWFAWAHRRARPYVFVGWFWYLVMPVPVIGVSIAVAWSVRKMAVRWSRGPVMAAGVAAAVMIALAFATRAQVSHWRSSLALWEHASTAVPGNYRAHANFGHALEAERRFDEAIRENREALRIKPDYAEARNNLGSVLLETGKPAEAIPELREAVRLSPRSVTVHNNLGLALAATGQSGEATGHFNDAIRLNPLFAPAHGNLGVVLAQQGRFDDAVAAFQESLRLQPDAPQAHQNLARALTDRGRGRFDQAQLDAALADFDAAIATAPDFADAFHERGRTLLAIGRQDEALQALLEASRLAPKVANFHYDAAVVLIRLQRIPDALRMLEAALLVDPNHADARATARAILKARR